MLSDGVTVVNAPTAGASATGTGVNEAGVQGGSCAVGWLMCGSMEGGGCCPTGYKCQGGECLVGTGAAASSVGQGAVGGGARGWREQGRWTVGVGVVVGSFWLL